jgi:tetratricopeptide (TPR) repeat protein
VQRLAPRELADVLRAWGRTRAMDAMAVVASYVDAEQRMVRDAAREALESYGQHALWQSREAFRARLGEDADLAWGWRRTLEELVRRLDARRFARVDEELAEARTAISESQLDAAEHSLTALLAHTPDLAHAGVADALHQLADLRLARGEQARARGLYERALRLLPPGADAGAIDARLAYLSAEEALGAGFVDVDAYERAASLDPTCVECATTAAAVREQSALPPGEGVARVPLLAGAAVLFALLGLGLLFAGARSSGAPPAPPSGEHDAPDLADSTLPG